MTIPGEQSEACRESPARLPKPDRVTPEIFADFPVTSIDFVLQAVDRVPLPEFSGSTFRGLLGHSLKTVACKNEPVCSSCANPESCAYTYLFETTAPRDVGSYRGSDEVPRPFILAPPIQGQVFKPGERFRLGLRLLGRGVEYLPFFVYCIEEMGRRGVGQVPARFQLLEAVSLSPTGRTRRFYVSSRGPRPGAFEGEPCREPLSAWMQPAAADPETNRLTVCFRTPTRLVYRCQTCSRPEFTSSSAPC